LSDNFGQTYSDPDLLKHLEKEHHRISTEAIQMAKTHAWQEQPKEGDRLESYIAGIRSEYNLLAAEAHHRVQAESQLHFGKLDLDYVRDKDREIELEIDSVQSSLNAQPKTRSISYSVMYRVIIALILNLVLWVSEVTFIGKTLALTGGGAFANRIMALGIATGLLVTSHLTGRLLSRIKSRILRRLTLGAILLFLAGIFVTLGVLRQQYFQQVEVQLPLWMFVGFNILFFLSAYLIGVFVLFPALKELSSQWKVYRAKRHLVRLNKQLANLKQKRAANIETLQSRSKSRIAIVSSAKSIQDLIVRYYEITVSLYLKTNLEKRDTPMPSCFHDPIKPLDTYYNDINI
jgi:hypothetical protein